MRNAELGRGMSASGAAGLAKRFTLGSRPALQDWRRVLPSSSCLPCGSGGAFCLRSRLLFDALRSVHARHCGSGDAFCARFMPAVRFWRRVSPRFMPGIVGLLLRFTLVHARLCGAVAASCPRFTLAVRFWRRGLPWFTPGIAGLAACLALKFMPAVRFWRGGLRSVHARRAVLAGRFASVHARLCGAVDASCLRFTPGFAVLATRFALVHARRAVLAGRFALGSCPPCGSVVALSSCPASRFWRRVLPSFTPGFAGLATRFALSSCPALRGCRRVLPSFTPGIAGLLMRFALRSCLPRDSDDASCLRSRLLFDALRQTGRLAISCVSIPPGRDRHSYVLAVSVRLSALAGSLRACTFLYGDPDG